MKKERGKSEKLRRAVILLKADVDDPGWNDEKISDAVGCRIRTVENVRREFVLEGFEAALAAIEMVSLRRKLKENGNQSGGKA